MSDGSMSGGLPSIPFERAAPPPSATLVAKLGRLRRVPTRHPRRTLAVVTGAAAVYPLYALAQFPLREDLRGLPLAWFLPVALLWLAGFLLPLVLALRPRRGQVLPDDEAAGRAAVAGAVVLTAVALFTIDAPGLTIVPAATWADFSAAFWHCISFGLHIVVPALLAGVVALARVMLVGAARLGAAIGAAGGALSGLTLHVLCPIGGVLHVATAHAGAVVLGAVLGALTFPAVRALVDRLRR